MHVADLPDPTTAQLEETTRIPIDKLVFGNRQIRVVEWGRGVEYTNLFEQFAKFDPESILQKTLIRQMDHSMDAAAAAAFKSTDVKLIFEPTSMTSGTLETGGVAQATATSNLTFDHCGVLADYMAGSYHIPPYEGEDFIGLSCRKTLRGLKSDPLWQGLHMYLREGDLFFKGEVGKTENIRWVQVDFELSFSNTAGHSSVLGEAVVFGDEAVVRVEVEAPALYADPNYQSDFGRTKAIAWRGILSFASKWDTANDKEAKIIRISSL
jgi:N4-gp56 family major capsid protein